jgi:uncharacterized membrane protein
MEPESPWRLGVFYFDKTDPRLWVAKRSGLGWTLNFARGASWAFVAAFMLVAALQVLIVIRLRAR